MEQPAVVLEVGSASVNAISASSWTTATTRGARNVGQGATKFLKTLACLSVCGVSSATELCEYNGAVTLAQGAEQKQKYTFGLTDVLMFIGLLTVMWFLVTAAWTRRSPRPETADKRCQAQCTYTAVRGNAVPRFEFLQDRDTAVLDY